MGLEGVTPVQQDGRIRIPMQIRDKYIGDEFAWTEPEDGVLRLQRVEVTGE